ncbi:FDLD family class I lanthipeptide [Allokutzneria sp. A3M-2-11 16]|uniref:FDLD family class I lanthipeptide n=1 Tax=Allokutzneria sp. A3M-2-11 16 TaxID=2962043 RepID=UPI0020B829F8|nr:FDLD family class I lanthipeptide [Allokutzneria sp. A3M-2-11 16]MCP3802263.1 FDLD family class I lanthipeptide [Allokutzneria sp. A3M-2-11 16]
MNPDLDQFDLDVRVSTPREQADGFATGGTTTLRSCFTCGGGQCGITTSAPGN